MRYIQTSVKEKIILGGGILASTHFYLGAMQVTQDNPFAKYDTQHQVFGVRQRKRCRRIFALVTNLAVLLYIGLFVGVAVLLDRSGHPPSRMWTGILGVWTMFAIPAAAMRYYGAIQSRIFKQPLERKILSRHGVDLSKSYFVGISPGRDLRVYAGESVLDISFLSIQPDKIVFTGDVVAFELSKDSVKGVELVQGMFMFCISRIIISWVDPDGSAQELAVELHDALRVFGKHRKTDRLFAALSEWQRNGATLPASEIMQRQPPKVEDYMAVALRSVPQGMSCLTLLGAVSLLPVSSSIFDSYKAGQSAPIDAVILLAVLLAMLAYTGWRELKMYN